MRSRNTRLDLLAAFAVTAMLLAPTSAGATPCGNGPGGFNPWLSQFKLEASAKGISGPTISRAFDGVTYDPKVIRLDRGQRSFKQSFERFYKRRASPWLLDKARGKLKRHASLLSRIERRYGVPPEIVVTIWGMESTFGQLSGKMSIIRSLSTLAYDCRRSEFLTNELHAALRIVERGDMSPPQMRGGRAGEIGQTQFLASSYVKYAVDFDSDGHRDLIRSIPDRARLDGQFPPAPWLAARRTLGAGHPELRRPEAMEPCKRLPAHDCQARRRSGRPRLGAPP